MTRQFTRVVGFDSETYRIRKGRNVPQFVCGTSAIVTPGGENVEKGIELNPEKWADLFEVWLADPATLLIAQNAPYDLCVVAHIRPALLPLIFAAIDEGRISCTETREKLITIAHGHTEIDPALGVPPSYSLDQMVFKYCNVDLSDNKIKSRTEEAEPDYIVFDGEVDWARRQWRLDYYELHGVPLEKWPQSAVAYAMEDAEWVLPVHRAQCETPKTSAGSVVQPDGIWLVDEIPNIRAAFALHLCSVWGLRTNPGRVEKTLKEWMKIQQEGLSIGYEMGFVRGDNGFRDGEIPRPRKKAEREALMEREGYAPDHVWPKRGKPWSVDLKRLQALVVKAYEAQGEPVPRGKPTEKMVEKAFAAWEKAGSQGEWDPHSVLGNIKYGADYLRLSGDPQLERYADCTTYMTYMTKFASTLRAGTTRPITSRPNVIVRTGRTSWTKPPLQQPPKKGSFRECHEPRPGYVYVSVDYDAIEMTALAQAHLDWDLGSTMADAIREGRDLHTDFATYTIGIPYERGLELRRLANNGDPEGIEFNDGPRFRAKAGNFGFPGGMGPRKFIEAQLKQGATLAMFAPTTGTMREAIETAYGLKQDWLQKWPEMAAYFAIVASLTELGSYTAVQPVSGRLRGGVGYCDGCNTYFQGRVADGAKAALWELSRRCYGGEMGSMSNAMYDAIQQLERPDYAATPDDPLWGTRPVLFLHDEIIVEMPEERLNPGADEMAKVMRDVMQLYMPDIPIGAEPAASRIWSKNAATIRDSSGRLLVWEP